MEGVILVKNRGWKGRGCNSCQLRRIERAEPSLEGSLEEEDGDCQYGRIAVPYDSGLCYVGGLDDLIA